MISRIIIGLLFFVFAAVQYNDPDPWLWIIAYAVVGIVCMMDIKKIVPKPVVLALTIIFGIATARYVPLMMNWVSDGMPSIAGEMKATTPHIEWMREFLGLLLCTITLFWLSRSNKLIGSND